MKTQLPPGVEEHFADMPAEMTDLVGQHVLSLTHTDLPQPTADEIKLLNPNYSTAYAVPKPEGTLTEEQIGISQRVEQQMERAAFYMNSVYQKEKVDGEDMSYYVIQQARRLAKDTAREAKEAGDQQAAVEAMESYFVLRVLFEEEAEPVNHRAIPPTEITHAVEDGLADEIVMAAHAVHGLVSIKPRPYNIHPKKEGVEIIPAGPRPGVESVVTRMVSNLEANDDFSEIAPKPPRDKDALTLEEHEQIRSLDASYCFSVALGLDKQGGNAGRAAEMAEISLGIPGGQEEYANYSVVADPLKLVSLKQICERGDAAHREAQYTQQLLDRLGAYRQFREAGMQGRRHEHAHVQLDKLIVRLVAKGESELAYQLISASPRDDARSSHSNFRESAAAQGVLDKYPASFARDIETRISQLQRQRQAKLEGKLSQAGYSRELINLVIAKSPNPEQYGAVTDQQLIGYLNRGATLAENSTGAHAMEVVLTLDVREVADTYAQTSAFLGGDPAGDEVISGLLAYRDLELSGDIPTLLGKFAEAVPFDQTSGGPEEVRDRIARIKILTRRTQAWDFDNLDTVWDVGLQVYGDERAAYEAITSAGPDFAKIYELYKSSQGSSTETDFNRDVLDTIDIFGRAADLPTLKLVGMIKDGKMPYYDLDNTVPVYDREPLGITEFGQAGLDQLKATVKAFTDDLDANQDITLERILSSPYLESVATRWRYDHQVDPALERLFKASNVVAGVSTMYPDRQDLMKLYKELYGTEEAVITNLLEDPETTARIGRLFLEGDEKDRPMFRKHMAKTLELFGNATTKSSLYAVAGIMEGDTGGPALAELGITKSGEAGIEQLKAFVAKFKQQIFERGEIPTDLVVDNPLAQDILKSIVRYEISEYGKQRTNDLLIQYLERDRDHPAKLPEGYEVGEIQVATTDNEARRAFKVSEDGVNQFKSHSKAIVRALRITSGGQMNFEELGILLTEIQATAGGRAEDIDKGLSRMRQKIAQLEEQGKDTTGITKRLAEQETDLGDLRAINYSDVDDFTIHSLVEEIAVLAKHKDIVQSGQLQSLLIGVSMAVGAANGAVLPTLMFHEADYAPHIDEVVDMSNYIGHLVNQETWGDLFEAVGGTKGLNEILNIDALEANIRRSSSIETAGTKPLRIIPAKGTLLELSGQMGDACWATKYQSITDEFPNFTALTFVQNPDNASRRIAGAALLIETDSADGQPLLVIRGLNPLENVVTQLSAESFYDEIVGYVKQIGERTGRQVAVVIDDHSGGSGTNRPTLFAHLSSIRPKLTRVPLKSEQGTTFNGYNIVDDTYLVN